MIKNSFNKKIFLFLFFFAFQWGGQLSAAGASRSGDSFSFYLILLYLCFLIRGGIWLFILKDMRLVAAYSLSSLGYLVIPFLSFILLGEPLQMKHGYGGVLILAGITLFGLGEERRRERLKGAQV